MAERRITANLKLLREWSTRPAQAGNARTLRFRFFSAPVGILGDGRVAAVRVERTVVDSASGTSVGTGRFEVIPAGLVVRAVGYQGAAIAGLPFDDALGVVFNTAGRVVQPPPADSATGEYVAGWLKRGPTGVIGTNKVDARETVRTMLDDVRDGRLRATVDRPELDDLLAARGISAVPFAGWEAIDRAELALGTAQGRPRSKITDWRTLRGLGCTGAPTAPEAEG